MRRNAIANLLGQGWSAAMALAFVPAYLRILGLEAWGLVGVMVTAQAWFALLDLGLSPALAREAARLTAGGTTAAAVRDLLRALEALLGGLALVVLAAIVLSAPWLVGNWIVPRALDAGEVTVAVRLIGVVIAARLVEQVHRSVLQGLAAQVPLNAVLAAMATVRWPGALAILAFAAPTVTAFFAWQAAVSLITPAIVAAVAYRSLPRGEGRTRFGWGELARVRRFVGGLAAATMLGVAFAQSDKLLLSGLLPLAGFGSYMLAATVAGALYFLVAPIVTAAQPQLTALASRNDRGGLAAAYRATTAWLAVIVLPPGAVLVVLPETLLRAWTGDGALAIEAAPILRLLAIGTMLNALTNPPTMMEIAHGRTRLLVRLNAAALVTASIALLLIVPHLGGIGAAAIWIAMNALYLSLIHTVRSA
jgi:O-antigen/teichoic acid export membrane protein